MKRATFLETFDDRDDAFDRMVDLNLAYERAGNRRDTACLVAGPEDDWVVCDLPTAIDTGLPYTWSVSRLHRV